jgi:diguanylate cyclase (GGDEF)-like protein
LTPIPPELQSAYRAHRLAEFERLVKLWSPLLPISFMVFQAFTFIFYMGELKGPDLPVLLKSEGLCLALAATGLLLAHTDRCRPSFDRWVPWMFGLITAIKVTAGFLFHSQVLALNQVYITLLVLLIGTLGLQLSIRAAVRGGALGALPFLALPWVSNISFALLFLGHYALTWCVVVFVVAVRDDKERMMFLRAQRYQRERQEVQRLNAELAVLARRDGLTGLANRRVFDESLKAEWDRARRQRTSLALLMVDVDHFKRYNDRYGHPAGDRCLSDIAAVLARLVRRPGDVAARYGGEEFVLLLPETDLAGACALAERLIEQVDALHIPHEDSPTAANVTVSVGVSVGVPWGALTGRSLLDAGDMALYEAKSTGRHGLAAVPLGTPGPAD